jgi:hypothetical protein
MANPFNVEITQEGRRGSVIHREVEWHSYEISEDFINIRQDG